MAAVMKAVTLTGFGGTDVLEYCDVPVPEPAAGEVLVEIKACGINPIDWKTRAGSGVGARWQNVTLPAIIGWDIAGVVTRSNAEAFSTGDEVYTMARFPAPGGGYAQYAAVPAVEIAEKPPGLDFVAAASVPLAALTAWQALIETAHLQKGQTVLVHAAAGGVGHFAVQIARWKGAKVIGTASARNHEFVRELGAEQVIDYRTAAFEEQAANVDVVLHTIGPGEQAKSFRTLKKGGLLVSITGPIDEEAAARQEAKGTRVLVRPSGEHLAAIRELIDQGAIKPHIDKIFPLTEMGKAHDYVEAGHTRGKVVVEI